MFSADDDRDRRVEPQPAVSAPARRPRRRRRSPDVGEQMARVGLQRDRTVLARPASIATRARRSAADSTTVSARPSPSDCSGCGSTKRRTAAQTMATAAAEDQHALEAAREVLGLVWPYGDRRRPVLGAATVTIVSANTARRQVDEATPARRTSSPTDPVSHQARELHARSSQSPPQSTAAGTS